MEKKRVNYIDVCKGIGIILVCVGHAITNQPKAADSTYIYPLAFISQFHMPLFFILSGMVLSEKYFINPIKASFKKFFSIYIPFTCYSLGFVMLHNIFCKLNMYNDYYDIKIYVREVVKALTMHLQNIGGAMWFLRPLLLDTLFLIWICYIFIELLSLKRAEIYVAGIAVILALIGISGKCPTIMNLDAALAYFPFFTLGFMYKKYNLNSWVLKYKKIIIPISIVVEACAPLIYKVGISGKFTFQYYWFFIITALVGSLMVISLAQTKLIENNKVMQVLGRFSLDIMSLHFLCFKLISAIIILAYNLDWNAMGNLPVVFGISGWWWLLYTVVGLSLPIGIRKIWNYIYNKLKIVVLGKRSS